MSKNTKQRRRIDRLSRRGAAEEPLSYRALPVQPSSIDLENRSIGAQISSETPVLVPDFDRWEMVPEVLRTDGAVLPADGQAPLLDNHRRLSTDDQLGSVRGLKTGKDGVKGRPTFSATAEKQWTQVREGHVRDVSAGYKVLEKTYVPKGTSQTIRGREYTGPVNVVTKWQLREVSVTPIGADEQAKMRGLASLKKPLTLPQTSPPSRSGTPFMNDQLRALCVSKGMKADATDDEAQRFLADTIGKLATAPPPEKEGERKEPELPTAEKLAELITKATRAAVAEEKVRAEAFRKEIDGLIEISGIEANDAQRADFYRLDTLEKVRSSIIEAKKKAETEIPGGYGPERIRWTGNGRDEQRSDMTTSIILRALDGAKPATVDKVFPTAERGKHPENFKGAGIFEIARQCLELDGIRTRGLNREEVAMTALGFGRQAGVRGAFDPAYHDTGSFTKLTQDAINKSMMVGYTECPATWDVVFRRGTSAEDFKTIHRIRFGAIPNIPDWPSNIDPTAVSLADAEETYRVQAKSSYISFSYQLLVNDDMSVLARVPGMFGAAAKRTVNAVAWAQVTGNPTMGDSVALFSGVSGARKRANTTTGVNVPSVANLQTLKNLMRQMRGENTPEGAESQDILNLQPRFIVGPGALETKIKQLVLSAYDPAASQFQTYNTATELTPVIEPLLDVNSTVAWYVMADTSQIDTVEVTFLTGHESPVTRNWADPAKLTQNYAVLQCFAAKALNHRGLQRMEGA